MNIAILFVGQQRWYDVTNYSYIKNFLPLLADHNVQYFAHLWKIGDPDPKFDKTIEETGFEQFKKIYSPIELEIENQKSANDLRSIFKMKKDIHGNLLSQSYSFYKSFLLLEKYQKIHNIKFDLYIKLRTDLAFVNEVNFDFDESSIYTKDMGDWRKSEDYIHDYMFFTKNYNHVERMAKIGFDFDKILSFSNFLYCKANSVCPEEILAKHLINNKIINKPYSFNVDLARNLEHSFTFEEIIKDNIIT